MSDSSRSVPPTIESPEGAYQFQVLCPSCSGSVESWNMRILEHADTDERLPHNPLGTRGEYTEIVLECFSGHPLRIVTANHKGCQYLAVLPGLPQTETASSASSNEMGA